MRIPTVAALEEAISSRGWTIHREPWRLNIVALRRTPGTLDAFDDMLCVIYTNVIGERLLWAARCTTDPGRPSRENPRRRDGTAVVAVGQLVDGFALGKHKGEYDCLVPAVPVPVLRYTSVDDPTGDPSTSNSTQIHRASAVKESSVVGPWSEGCIVVANPINFAQLMALADAQVKRLGHRRFTVSVLEWPAMPPTDPYDGADLRADLRDLRAKIDGVAVTVAGLAARHEAQASDVGYFRGRMSDVESRLRLAEKHEENAKRIGAIEVEVAALRTQLQSAAPLSTVNDALRQLADLQITKARIAGLLVGAAAAGGMGGGLVQLLAGALGG